MSEQRNTSTSETTNDAASAGTDGAPRRILITGANRSLGREAARQLIEAGYTATDFNAHSGPQTVEEGAEIIVRAAQFGPDGPTGAYLDREGTLPW